MSANEELIALAKSSLATILPLLSPASSGAVYSTGALPSEN